MKMAPRSCELWTFNGGHVKYHGRVGLDDRRFVDGETPIEDFGDFLLTHDRLSPDNAFARFLALTAAQEEV